jgi:TP901 family phage tail tape measure protein
VPIDANANIGIRVFIDDAASKGLFGVNQQLASMKNLVTGAAAAFALFAGGLAYAIVQGAGIAAAMTQISLATGMTKSQLAELQPFLLNLGGNSIFSLKQLADGMALLGQYSYKTVPAIEALSNAGTKLAEVTGSAPVDAFRLLAVTMQAFNLPANDANYVASLLFYSFEHGTPNVSQMTTALGQLGGAAQFLHIPLSQLIPALDVVTVGVGSASTAAAGLRFLLNNVTGSSAGARAAFAALGMTAFDAKGQFVGLPQLLSEISDHLKGLSTADQYKVLQELFNIRSGTAIKQLITQLDEYTTRLKETSNATKLQKDLDAAVAQVLGNVGNVLKEVGTNFQDFAGEVGLTVLPILIGFLKNAVLPLVTGLRLLAANPAFATGIAAFLALGAAISGVFLFVGLLGTALATTFAWFMLFTAGAAVLAGGIEFLVVNWNNIVAAVNRARPVLQAVGVVLLTLGGIIAAIALTGFIVDLIHIVAMGILVGSTMLTAAIPAIVTFGLDLLAASYGAVAWVAANATLIPSILATAAASALAGLKTAATAAINFAIMIPSLVATAAAWLLTAAASMLAVAPYILIGAAIVGAVVGLGLLVAHLGFLNVLLALGRAAWAAILPPLQEAGNAIKGAFLQAVQQLQPLWQQLVNAFNQAKPILVVLGAVLGTVIVAAIAVLIGVVRMLISVLGNIIVTAIHIITSVIQIFTGLVQFFTGLFKIIFGIFTLNGTLIQQGWTLLWTGITNIAKGIFSGIVALFTGFFRTVLGGITNFISGIIGFFKNLWNMLVGHSIVPDMLAAIVSAFAALPGKVLGVLAALAGNLWSTFTTAWNRGLDAVKNGISSAVSKIKELPGDAVSALGNLGSTLWNAGTSLIGGFIGGIKSMIGSVGNAVGNVLNGARNLFPHSPVKEGPLVGYENWMPTMIHTLASTAEQAGPSLKSSMAKVAQGVQSGFAPSTGLGVGGAGSSQFVIMLDGKVIFDSMQSRMRNALQAQGISRMLK